MHNSALRTYYIAASSNKPFLYVITVSILKVMPFVYLYILRINTDYEIFDLLRCYAAYIGI